jgi:hypothetical protein
MTSEAFHAAAGLGFSFVRSRLACRASASLPALFFPSFPSAIISSHPELSLLASVDALSHSSLPHNLLRVLLGFCTKGIHQSSKQLSGGIALHKRSMKIRDYHLIGPFRQWRARSGRCLLANLSLSACCRHFHHARRTARIRDRSADVGNRSTFSTKRIHQSS